MRRTTMTAAGVLCAAAVVMTLGGTSFAEGTKTLRVAMECSHAPYNWTQPTDENGAVPIADSKQYAYGYDVMIAKHICEELGWDLEIVKLDWDALVPAVVSDTVDCAIAGQAITPERVQYVDFTTPYYYASVITLTKADSAYRYAKGVADLAGAKCTSQFSTVGYDTCLPQIPDADILPAQESVSKMLEALDADKCDLVVTDLPTGMAACVAYPDFMLLDFSGSEDDFEVSDEELSIGISLRKGNTELLEALCGVLEEMTVEDYEEMMSEAISVWPPVEAE